MKLIQWTTIIVIIAIIFIKGFWPARFQIDTYTILLLFFLAIPLLAPYLKRAKFFGAEFDFRESIIQTSKLISQSENKVKKKPKLESSYFTTFSVETSLKLVAEDPSLALASLRIEIERALTNAAKMLISDPIRLTLNAIIKTLNKKGYIFKEEAEAIKQIINICNRAIHGANISEPEAREVIDLASRLRDSFTSIGYSIDFHPNPKFKDHGLVCEWEHCIERFSLPNKSGEQSCHIFGHDCPGGAKRSIECKKEMEMN